MQYTKYEGYLTEQKLGEVLSQIYPNYNIIPQYKIKINKSSFYVDFYVEEISTIFEFDGHYHFTSPSNIVRDNKIKRYCEDNGITLVNIPYFIQLDYTVSMLLLGVDFNFTDYKHGFIDSKQFPSTFCSLGVIKYNNFLDKLNKLNMFNVLDDIDNSLCEQVIKNKSVSKVLHYEDIKNPDTLFLLNETLIEKGLSIDDRLEIFEDYLLLINEGLIEDEFEIYSILTDNDNNMYRVPLGLLSIDEMEKGGIDLIHQYSTGLNVLQECE